MLFVFLNYGNGWRGLDLEIRGRDERNLGFSYEIWRERNRREREREKEREIRCLGFGEANSGIKTIIRDPMVDNIPLKPIQRLKS